MAYRRTTGHWVTSFDTLVRRKLGEFYIHYRSRDSDVLLLRRRLAFLDTCMARCANPCAVVRRRAHCSSIVRSLGLITRRMGRGPRLAIRASLYSMYERHGQSVYELQIRDTRSVDDTDRTRSGQPR